MNVYMSERKTVRCVSNFSMVIVIQFCFLQSNPLNSNIFLCEGVRKDEKKRAQKIWSRNLFSFVALCFLLVKKSFFLRLVFVANVKLT